MNDTDYVTIIDGLLTVYNVSMERDANSSYWCTANNTFGTVQSDEARIAFIGEYLEILLGADRYSFHRLN